MISLPNYFLSLFINLYYLHKLNKKSKYVKYSDRPTMYLAMINTDNIPQTSPKTLMRV